MEFLFFLLNKHCEMTPNTLRPFRCLFLLFFLLLCSEAPAQVQRPINGLIARQAAQLLQAQKAIANNEQMVNRTYDLNKLERFLNTQLFQTELLKEEWYQKQIDKLKKHTGVNLSANYQHNEYSAFYEDFEQDARFRAGLEWDLMENGLMERNSDRKRLEKDREIHQMESLLTSRERNYAFLYNCLIYNFNKEKIVLLEKRTAFLEEYIRLLYELYFAHELAYTEIIKQKSRLNEASILLAGAKDFNQALEKEIGTENIAVLDIPSLPVVQIDVERLLDPGDLTAYQDSLKALKDQRIDLTYKKRIDARLKLYTRYNYGSFRVADNERSFISFGVNFQAPIQLGRKIDEELKTYEKAMVEEVFSEEWYNRVKEIMILYEEYQYKIKQYSNFLHKTFHYEEKLRVEQVLLDSRKDVHTPMKSLGHIDNDQAVAFELIHLKQQLYLLILKIHLRSFQKDFLSCLYPLDFSGGNKKFIGNRLTILDSSKDGRLDPEFLIKYLQKNEINQVLLKGQGTVFAQWAEILLSEGFLVYYPEGTQNYISTGILNQFKGKYSRNDYSGQLLLSAHPLGGQKILPQKQVTKVPDKIFTNRNEMERWIKLENKNNGTTNFLFEDIRRIMELDKKNLGVE